MLAPLNVYPACPVAPADGTGVKCEAYSTGAFVFLFNRGDAGTWAKWERAQGYGISFL